MKRILSLLLIIGILLSVPAWGSAAGADATVDKAAEILVGLGIMENLSDDKFHPEYKITRAEMAQALYKILKDTYVAEAETDDNGMVVSSFPDVTEPSLILAVETVKSAGLISGFPDGTFKPESELTYVQLVKIVIKLLGFDFLAEKIGGFPYGYISQASKLGITDGITVASIDQSINRGCVALILYRTLRTNMLDEVFYQGDSVYYSDKNSISAFYRYLGIRFGNDYVVSTPHTSLTNANAQSRNFYAIGQNTFMSDVNDYTPLIGLNCEFYYKEDGGVNKLLYMVSDEYDEDYHITIKAENIQKFSSAKREYYYTNENGKTEKIKFSASANVIYNGVFAGDVLTEKEYTPDDGYVELYDTDKNGSFDLVNIVEYTFMVVGRIHSEDEEIYTFYDKFDGKKKVSIEDESLSIIRRTNGKVIPVYEIKEGDILTLIISKGELVSGVIGGKKKEAIATVADSVSDRIVLTIDEAENMAAKSCYSEGFGGKINSVLGQKMLFYIDTYGYIFAIEKADAEYSFEYLIAAQTNPMGSQFAMKTYSIEDKFVIDKIEYSIIVDGAKCKKAKDIYDAVTKYGLGKPMMVERNKNGEVVKIDTLYFDRNNEMADGSFNRFFPSDEMTGATNLIYKVTPGVFFYRRNADWEVTNDSKSPVAINNDTKIMYVPSDIKNEEEYYIDTISNLVNDEEYPIEAYSSKQTYGFAEFIIVQNDGQVSLIKDNSSQPMAVICSVKQVYDKETREEIVKLCYYQNGTFMEKICEKTSYKYGSGSESQIVQLSDLKEGDVVRISVNGKGCVESIYPYCLNKTPMPSDESGYRTNRMMNVYAKYDNNIIAVPVDTVLKNDGTTTFEEIRVNSELFRSDKFKVYLYDSSKKEKERVSVAGIDEIYDYVNYGMSEMSNIFVNTRLNNPGVIVIYK